MDFRAKAKELVSKMTLSEKMSQLCNKAPAIERLGVVEYDWWSEALHGAARAGSATVFPQCIGMAASFDTELVKRAGDIAATEARAKYNEFKKFGSTTIYQGLSQCAPNINIFRDPRWGRGQETYGEDPYLTGRMGTAYVQGLQGDGKYHKNDATLKHFAVHSGPESIRHGFNAVVSEKDLRETYLWAFKYCIDNAKPASVMGAYNAVNGEPATAGERLTKEILYGEWGFDGYVVSDEGSVANAHKHHKITKNETESAAYALNNGCQLNIGESYLCLPEAYERGLVTEETITQAAEKLFEARFRLGMFDEECEFNSIPYDVIECDEHRKVNRSLAASSLVLLKNNGILPFKNPKKIAVIGPNADDVEVLLGNYNGTPSKYTTLLRGIQEGCGGADVMYAKGCDAIADLKYPMCYDPIEDNSIPYDVIECDEHRKVNRSLAASSLVLLKNNGILPFKNPKKIAVIGPNADDVEVLLGNYNGTPSKYTTLLRGIQEGCGGADVMYAKGCDAIADLKYPMCYDPIEEALIVAKLADVVILCVGLNPSMEGEENSAENSANCGDKDSLELPEVQKRLIEAVAAIGKPTVFVNVSGSCVNLEYADKKFDAVIQYFYPGAEGGAALADVLFGRVSPSGRLPVTFYRSTDDLPDFADYSMENRTYKFFKGTPVYPFGHGLSYSEISENWIDDSTVELKNLGEYDTAYTVLKYEYIPHKNLCDFKKVFIRKGETLIVKF